MHHLLERTGRGRLMLNGNAQALAALPPAFAPSSPSDGDWCGSGRWCGGGLTFRVIGFGPELTDTDLTEAEARDAFEQFRVHDTEMLLALAGRERRARRG